MIIAMIHIEPGSTQEQSLPFEIEEWIELAIGMFVILLRLFARTRAVGFRKWQGDDYLSIVTLVLWGTEVFMFKFVFRFGANARLTDAHRASMEEWEMNERQFGAKCLLISWIVYVTLIWMLKACMLFFYKRLTIGLVQQKYVKVAAGLCSGTYIAAILTILLHCTPIDKLWQIYPNPGKACTQGSANYIGVAVTNILTDAVLLSIPLPLLIQVQLPWRRKLVIGLLLFGGVFVMVAALFRCILSLWHIESVNTSNLWATRETIIAVITVNIPCIWPLLRRSSSSPDVSAGGSGVGRYKMGPLAGTGAANRRPAGAESILEDSQSQFVSNVRGGSDRAVEEEAGRCVDGIQVTTEYEVKHDSDGAKSGG
ncbi:hypothetical protein ASPBRDRAFT_677000 [Aspergillus brasiliensis CBS 101740]|uniref:Rhodopsin domain-containing protein n=1 Tax=Aspergillus brasiliensis (strain CBS 101740 / IMI 381727 / IBT 21946) TaxID=767769 RepID=A0A1L9UFA7_ASPBC|nr:hypothetical protein ASPBRDRAFT_677000 [Aspergillus brasiliensis CBS 101740]